MYNYHWCLLAHDQMWCGISVTRKLTHILRLKLSTNDIKEFNRNLQICIWPCSLSDFSRRKWQSAMPPLRMSQTTEDMSDWLGRETYLLGYSGIFLFVLFCFLSKLLLPQTQIGWKFDLQVWWWISTCLGNQLVIYGKITYTETIKIEKQIKILFKRVVFFLSSSGETIMGYVYFL